VSESSVAVPKPRILHIEDNRENRMLVRAILEAAGHTVIDAEDGLSGIEAAIREQPDLVLLDVNLPGVDGYEVVSIIKSFPSFASTPVIAVTAYAMEGDRQRTLVAGCDGYIQKPIDVDTFPGQVAEFLRGKRERIEAREEGVYLRELNQRLVYRLVNQVEELRRLNQHFVRRAIQLAELHRSVEGVTSEVGVSELLHRLLPQLARALGTTTLTVQLDEPPGLTLTVQGDPDQRPRSVLKNPGEPHGEWAEVESSHPLTVHGRAIGTMIARHLVPPGARTDEEQLLNIVANQVASAVENARLYESMTHRAVEQESLVAAGRLLTSTLQVSEVLQRLAELVRGRLGGLVRIWLADTGTELRLSAEAGDATADSVDASGIVSARSLARAAFVQRAPLVIDGANRTIAEAHEVGPSVSFVGVPLLLEGQPVGVLTVIRQRPAPLRPEERGFAEALAASAAAAIRNARSYEETQQQLRNTEMLLAVNQTVGSTMDLTEVLRRAARAMARAIGADTAGGWLVDASGDLAIPMVGYHVPKQIFDAVLTPLDRTHPLLIEVRRSTCPVYASDSASDRRFDHPLGRLVSHRSILIQPIVLKGEVMGGFVLVWLRETHQFPDEELRLIEAIVRQVAVAIENARLLDAERRARVALEVSETRYRELFDNARDIVYLHELDGRLVAVNEAAVRASGYSRAELLAMTIDDLIVVNGGGSGVSTRTREALVGTDASALVDAELRTRDGRRVPLECSARVILHDGVPAAIQGVGRDITVRRQLEARQRAFVEIVKELAAEEDVERLFALIVERAADLSAADSAVIAVVEGDELRVVSLYNFPSADPLPERQPVADSEMGRVVTNRRRDGSADIQNDPQWSASVLVSLGYRAVLNVPIMLQDQVIGVLGVLSQRARTFSDEDVALIASLAGHTAVAIDRTNLLRKLKARLDESETLLRVSQAVSSTLDLTEMMRRVAKETAQALEADMVGAYLAGPDHDGLRPIAGYRVPPDLLETLTNETIPLRGLPLLEEAWRGQHPVLSSDAAADSRLDIAIVHRLPHRSLLFIPMIVKGEPIGGLFALWLERDHPVRADALRLVEGIARQSAVAIENSQLYEGVKRQMTELTQTQAQLVQSAKLAAIGELAANVAHEINNPLTTVLGFASYLAERMGPDAPHREELALIQEEAARARDIVRDLLQFSRQSDFLPVLADLNVVVEQVIAMMRRQGGVEQVEVRQCLAPDMPPVRLDVARIKQVFLNIINNAVHAMSGVGLLTVSTAVSAPWADIIFTDTGTGIAAEHLPRVFDPFFTTKPDVSGTGLGLSVSLGIVQSHGGTIEAQSEVGRGSMFTVRLPLGSPVPVASNG
jgi:PAS domain S-box-containing protein